MTDRDQDIDLWAIPNLLLWTAFFGIGLEPERTFVLLRQLSGVVTQSAWVNSPGLITAAFAVYLSVFVYHSCIGAGLEPRGAQGRAVQTGVLGLAAFLWYSPRQLIAWVQDIPVPELRWIVYGAAVMKLVSWLYLYLMVLRYVGLGQKRTFASMPVVFPSAGGRAGPSRE
ncbi:MAG: hypothetical protein GY851_15380 [bacterium]|nr:hypothetical protein [bacterium]